MTEKYKWHNYKKKPHMVKARLLTKDMSVETIEGTMSGKAGKHYLIIGTKKEKYIIRKDIFEALYVRME